MNLIDRVKQAVIEHCLIQKGDCIVVGVSGGPDSVCLLHILYNLKAIYDLTLTAVHVNHMLREGYADKDQRYTEELCAKMGIACHTFAFEIEKLAKEWKMTTEEAGRRARYESFYETANMVNGNKIAVAQNQNDQAETILMRLLRGTGTDGLAGIEPIRVVQDSFGKLKNNTSVKIIRPLLDISRADIEAYCDLHELNPRIDLTNAEPIYTRNKIRLELIPYLTDKYSPNIIEHLSQLAKISQEDKEYIYSMTEEVLKDQQDTGNGPCINKKIFNRQHPAVQKRIILRLFAKIGLTRNITALHLEKALDLITKNRTSARMDFPEGYGLQIGYDEINFLEPNRPEEEKSPEIRLVIGESIKADAFGMSIQCLLSNGKPDQQQAEYKQEIFDFDKIQGNLLLRTRKPGDVITPLGMSGSKKLKKFLIDEKIPAQLRQQIPLICVGNQVVWIVGYRMSDKFKVEENTERYLTIRIL